jgi:hypothetical protein
MTGNKAYKKFIYTHYLYVVIMGIIYYTISTRFLHTFLIHLSLRLRAWKKKKIYTYNEDIAI